MQRDELTNRIIKAIAEMQEKPADSIHIDSTFEELGIDSLNGFHLLCELEDQLEVVIPDDEAREIVTVRDVVDRVEPLLPSKS